MKSLDEIYRGTASECRYSDCVLLDTKKFNIKVIEDNSEADYQGCLEVLLELENKRTKKKTYKFIQYDYGSCSHCDPWEDSDINIIDEIQRLTLTMTESQLEAWKLRKVNNEGDI